MAFFFTFRVCHARDLAWELVNGDDGGGPPVGVYGKVAARNEDGVAHVYYKYLDGHIYYTYIHLDRLGLDPGAHLAGPVDKSINLERKNKSFRASLA